MKSIKKIKISEVFQLVIVYAVMNICFNAFLRIHERSAWFDWNGYEMVNVAWTVGVILSLFLMLPVGYLADKVGNKKTILMVLFGTGCVAIVMSIAKVSVLITALFLAGSLLMSIFYTIWPSSVLAVSGQEYFCRIYGIIFAVSACINLVPTALIRQYIDHIGDDRTQINMPFIVIAIVIFVIFMGILLFGIKRQELVVKKDGSAKEAFCTLDKKLLVCFAVCCIWSSSVSPRVNTLLNEYFSKLELQPSSVALFSNVTGLLYPIITIALGFVADKVHAVRLNITVAACVIAVGFFFMVTPSWPMYIILYIAIMVLKQLFTFGIYKQALTSMRSRYKAFDFALILFGLKIGDQAGQLWSKLVNEYTLGKIISMAIASAIIIGILIWLNNHREKADKY